MCYLLILQELHGGVEGLELIKLEIEDDIRCCILWVGWPNLWCQIVEELVVATQGEEELKEQSYIPPLTLPFSRPWVVKRSLIRKVEETKLMSILLSRHKRERDIILQEIRGTYKAFNTTKEKDGVCKLMQPIWEIGREVPSPMVRVSLPL